MTSWRDTASAQAQADYDTLLDAVLGFAQQLLTTSGEFYPFAAAIRTDGKAEMVAARPNPDDEHPRSDDVIAATIARLINQRDHIRACAIVADVRLTDVADVRLTERDAIRVDLEHAEGHALTILLPYAKKRLGRKIRFGQLRAQAGERRLWT